ncbi:MCE family protein OS=Streptomyces tendae OX=1932 GN=F3L20_25615 PE=4 SV=1 [Streptomyces tendae]
MAVTFFDPLPCTAGYGATRYRNGLDLGTAPPLNTGAACTAPASTGVNVRGSANAPRGGAVPEPARPGSLPSGGSGGGPAQRGNAALPGALGLPGQSGEAPRDLSHVLAPAGGGAR